MEQLETPKTKPKQNKTHKLYFLTKKQLETASIC